VEARVTERFVLLDRDGTINEEVGHISDPNQVRLIPGSLDAMRTLLGLGLGLVIVTNQANVGRGLLRMDQLERVNARLRDLLRAGGVEVEGIEVCPHRPEDGCACRKPKPGMALRAAEKFGFELTDAFVVGDHAGDMGLGRTVGATTILVRTGHGEEELANGAGADADAVVADLREAADVIRERVLSGAAR
jgi:D-glycero-D-manno-heptose 1,7-bisphosphate phosphatase